MFGESGRIHINGKSEFLNFFNVFLFKSYGTIYLASTGLQWNATYELLELILNSYIQIYVWSNDCESDIYKLYKSVITVNSMATSFWGKRPAAP